MSLSAPVRDEMVECGRPIPNVWGGRLDAVQSLGPRLRAVIWPVQGQSTAPDNLFDWLLADNRYPQHRGRAAALNFISEQTKEIAALTASQVEAGEVERLRKALEPFAKVADAFDYWCGEAMPEFSYPAQSCDLKFALEDCPNAVGELTESDFRTARAALAQSHGKEGGK